MRHKYAKPQTGNSLQQRLMAKQAEANDLSQQLAKETISRRELQTEVNDLKVSHHALIKEYENLLLSYNGERLSVMKPIYRNIYQKVGLALRKTMPSAWVQALKKLAPNPDGTPKRLAYQEQQSQQLATPHDMFTELVGASVSDIFIFSIINWDFRYQRPQHLAKGLADSGYRVFYIEMELEESGLKITKIDENVFRVRLSAENLGHIQAYTGQPNAQQTKKWIKAFYQLCDTVKSQAFKRVIVEHPFWWQLVRHLPPEYQIVFDCMDDMSGFSNTEKFLLDLEQDMLLKCDKLVVSSQYLFDKYKHLQMPALIRNAAELDHFSQPSEALSRPEFLKRFMDEEAGTTKEDVIKVGYVGAIAEWFDADLIKKVAKKDDKFEMHLCGAVTAEAPAQLEQYENIHLHGEIPYADVPGFLNEMDVLIIPFKIIPIIKACDPVKFYEYAAMGKPTVTTALPELARASELTFTASTATEFAEQIHHAYEKGQSPDFQKKLQEYAAKNTWKDRAEQFRAQLDDVKKVSVIILAFGDPELTKGTLFSIYDGGDSYPNLEVIIVDNGSPAKALAEIKKFAENYPNVNIIENGENLGFAKGNNVGLQAATGDYVLLLNNDTFVAPGAIYAMVRHLAHNTTIGVVGTLTNNIGNEARLAVDYEDMKQMKQAARDATTGYRDMYTSISVVAYFAVMFRRSDLEVFGLLSEEYGRGMFEDDDHCAQIKKQGYICALAEDAFVHHHLSATFSKMKESDRQALFNTNKEVFERKWGEWKPHQYRENRPISSLIK